jgi:hypothetical protein
MLNEQQKNKIKEGYLHFKRDSIIAAELGVRTVDVTNYKKQMEQQWVNEKILRKLPDGRCDLCGCVVYEEHEWKDITDMPAKNFDLSEALHYLSKKARLMFTPEAHKQSSVCVGCCVRFAEQHIFDGYYQDKSVKLKDFESE